jgi:hypothetical protein
LAISSENLLFSPRQAVSNRGLSFGFLSFFPRIEAAASVRTIAGRSSLNG